MWSLNYLTEVWNSFGEISNLYLFLQTARALWTVHATQPGPNRIQTPVFPVPSEFLLFFNGQTQTVIWFSTKALIPSCRWASNSCFIKVKFDGTNGQSGWPKFQIFERQVLKGSFQILKTSRFPWHCLTIPFSPNFSITFLHSQTPTNFIFLLRT